MHADTLTRRRFIELLGSSSAGTVLATTYGPAILHASPAAGSHQFQETIAAPAHPWRIEVEEIGVYDVERLNSVLTTELAEFASYEISYAPAKYPVKLYRVLYPSVIPELNNRPTTASGLIAIPDMGEDLPLALAPATLPALPVVSYQHGSVFGQDEVPSSPENSTETRLMVAIFASQGYMLVGADYFGRGQSTEPNSYIVKASTEQACLDLLFAAQAVAADLGVEMGPLFLSGWSQGGWSTFVFLHKLESLGIPVTAAAVASGPVDLYATTNRWANNWQPIDAVYITPLQSNMLNAFEYYYSWPGLADWAIKPQYRESARQLFRNEITIEEATPLLPPRFPDLLQDEFKAALAVGDDRFSRILQESHAYRWRSVTPARVYHGDIDEVTPIFIGTLPVGYQTVVGGAEVTAGDAGPKGDHRGVFLFGMKDQKEWFDGLLAAKK